MVVDQLVLGAQLWRRLVDKRRKLGRIGGTRLVYEMRGVFVAKTQEEICSSFVGGGARETWVSHLVWVLPVFTSAVNSGMSLTIEQVATQLQQKVTTLKDQVADQSGLIYSSGRSK